MTSEDRITALEARLAAAEARIAYLEANTARVYRQGEPYPNSAPFIPGTPMIPPISQPNFPWAPPWTVTRAVGSFETAVGPIALPGTVTYAAAGPKS